MRPRRLSDVVARPLNFCVRLRIVSAAVKSLLLAALLGWVGAKGAIWVVSDTATIIDSAGWKSTTARIERVWLDESNSHGRMFSPGVVYTFEVAGHTYSGDHFEVPPRRSGDRAFELGRLEPFAPGTRVEIFYDPSNPERSVLTRPQMNYWFTLGLGGLAVGLVAAAIALLYSAFRSLTIVGRDRETR